MTATVPVEPASRGARRSRRRLVARVLAHGVGGVVALLVAGNLLILGAWQLQAAVRGGERLSIDGVDNFHVVDARVWRGGAPEGATAYRSLAAHGVTTVIDLRAEDDVHVDEALLRSLGLDLVQIPIRDGQIPTAAEVELMLAAVSASTGPTFVHCGAGVGRTGAMVAAYQVVSGNTTPTEAMLDNLAVGPPSLEQLAFAASLNGGPSRPPAALVAISRMLDAPRRLWTYL